MCEKPVCENGLSKSAVGKLCCGRAAGSGSWKRPDIWSAAASGRPPARSASGRTSTTYPAEVPTRVRVRDRDGVRDRTRLPSRPGRPNPVGLGKQPAAAAHESPDHHNDTNDTNEIDSDPRAVAVLAGLRRVDPRLVLSVREAARLAPAVTRWLAAGLLPTQITDHLTAGLPDHLLVRPAGILAYRLKETPLTAPAVESRENPEEHPAILIMRNCDGCDRGFRSAGHSRCRDCRSRDQLPATG